MPKFFLIIITILILQSCNLKSTRTNNDNDLKKGREFVLDFYKQIKNNEQEKTYRLFGGGITESDLNKTFNLVNTYLGVLISYKEIIGNSLVVDEGGKITERYEFQYEVTYQKGIAKENIVLILENGELKIVGYDPVMKIKE